MKTNKIYNGDCIEIMKSLPSESIDLIFADPPFNIGLKYNNYQDNKSYDHYYEWSEKWIKETHRILKQTGAIYIAIGDEFAAEINIILKRNGYNFRNWIIWYYTFGQSQRKKFNRAHTHIFYFTKNKDSFFFNDEFVRIPSARQRIYNDKRANPNGKVPDDVWEFSRICGTFKERIGNHPCQMPENLLERIIKVSSNPNDVVLDPFGGTGTTAAVAKKLNRRFITMDISKKYFEIMAKRLDSNMITSEKSEIYISENLNLTLFEPVIEYKAKLKRMKS